MLKASLAALQVFAFLIWFAATAAAQEKVLTIAVLKFGTVKWELDTIGHYGLDTANGFHMQVQDVAGNPAAQVAFQGGTADVIVSDWIWVARQRAAGNDFVFLPYSKAVGGVMVPADSKAATLEDLAGSKIGIAGGPLDKSWLILQAYSEKQYGLDLAAQTEQVFGAPPLIYKTAIDGDLAGAINFWHFMAKMKAAGMRELISVAEASQALGLDPETPLLGYVFKGDLVRDNPELFTGFARASQAAKEILANDEAAWTRLRPLIKPANDAEFEALQAGFRSGIPKTGSVDRKSAAAMLSVMARFGGSDLVGAATELPEGVFVDFPD